MEFQRRIGGGDPDRPPLFCNPQPARPASPQPLGTLVIDAEEDFDWLNPVPGTRYSTACMRNIGDLQSIAGAWGVHPTYMLTYPVLQDAQAVRVLRRYLERGDCALGLQLHTWVTPPLDGPSGIPASFSGSLPAGIEERKLLALKAKFAACFGFEPLAYRSGRYGMSGTTASLLEEHGFEIDTSIAPRTCFAAEGGPDFSDFDCAPFWFGKQRRLLEIPLCRSVIGWGGPPARAAYQALTRPPLSGLRINSALTRSHAAERITLSPEGNGIADMRRLVRRLLARDCRVLTVSMHSSSLVVGQNPYVRSKADLHGFYDRLSAALAFLAGDIGCRFAPLPQVPSLMRPPAL